MHACVCVCVCVCVCTHTYVENMLYKISYLFCSLAFSFHFWNAAAN